MVDHITFRESEIRRHHALEKKYRNEPPPPRSRLSNPVQPRWRRERNQELVYYIKLDERLRREGRPHPSITEYLAMLRAGQEALQRRP